MSDFQVLIISLTVVIVAGMMLASKSQIKKCKHEFISSKFNPHLEYCTKCYKQRIINN